MNAERTEGTHGPWVTRVSDKILAVFVLICLSPLFAVVAVAIKIEGLLDPAAGGPVIWTARRISQGKPFNMFKYRTVRARPRPDEYERPDMKYTTWQTNPNATRVGRMLLKWYLDELPQLFNVLRGEMRLVGPRPVAQWEYERELAEGADSKRWVKAGWAGLIQAHKGRSASRQENMRLDAEYVQKVSIMTPLQRLRYELSVLVQTFRTAARGEGR